MKYTDEEMQIIEKNLKVGKCPNCGNEDKKYIFPEAVKLGGEGTGKDMYDAIITRCPECGLMLFFNKEFIMNK